jgi:DNA-3-methyladenine glycosylase II
MKKPPVYWNKAKIYLSKKDKVLKYLIKRYNTGHLISRNDVFFSLCKSIIGQQISVASANAVFLRFKKKCKGRINPKKINALRDAGCEIIVHPGRIADTLKKII